MTYTNTNFFAVIHALTAVKAVFLSQMLISYRIFPKISAGLIQEMLFWGKKVQNIKIRR